MILLLAASTILFLGDSVTYGVREGVTEDQTFRVLVSDSLGDKRINAGIPGSDSKDGLDRLKILLQMVNPNIVVIMFGINDALNQTQTVDQYKRNTELMIKLCGKRKVVLCTPNCLGYSFLQDNVLLKPYVDSLRNLKFKRTADIFQTFAENAVLFPPLESLLIDGQHPNPLGHQIIAKVILKLLVRKQRRQPSQSHTQEYQSP